MQNTKFTELHDFLQCPVCAKKMRVVGGNVLMCKNKHCFDIAKQGYVNLTASGGEIYTEELFKHRRMVFEAGFYGPLVKAIENAARRHSMAKTPTILDAGSGEGYYSIELFKGSPCNKIAFDISKDAIRLAAKSSKDVMWLVADLKNIPVAKQTIDIIADILTPADYSEFQRVLKDDGIVVKAVPGTNYLSELRMAAKEQLRNKKYDNSDVVEYFKKNLEVMETEQISYTLPVSYEQAVSFAKMTPMMSGVDITKINLDEIKEITVDMTVLTGRKKRR